jgi:hypothetical protein
MKAFSTLFSYPKDDVVAKAAPGVTSAKKI